MTHYVVPNTVLALPGFAAGVDWSDTLLLLGIAACMFVALGAFRDDHAGPPIAVPQHDTPSRGRTATASAASASPVARTGCVARQGPCRAAQLAHLQVA